MAVLKAKIISIEVKSDSNEEAQVVFRFGTKEIAKPFPDGHAFIRGSAIFDNEGNLSDCELVTEKI